MKVRVMGYTGWSVMVLALACAFAWWNRPWIWPTPLDRKDFFDEYDFIVIGAGTGGISVVHQLISGLNASVLLIEAGEQMGFKSSVPFLSPFLQGGPSDWGFKTVPQPLSSYGFLNYQQKWPRGKGLGGSAQINYMLYALGNAEEDFDRWKNDFGLQRWNFQEMNPFLEHEMEQSHVTDLNLQESRLGLYLKRAEMEFRKDGFPDVRAKTAQFTTKNGRRWSVFDELLSPLLDHPKLHVMTKATVSKIALVGRPGEKRAVGVHLAGRRDRGGFIRARKEIILSAGTVQSPQILMLSGIGPKQQLAGLKIPLHVDNEAVGGNLFDHFNVPLYVSITQPLSVTKSKILSPSEVMKYLLSGTGIFSTSSMIGTASRRGSSSGIILFGVGSVDEASLRMVSNLDFDAFQKVFPHHLNGSQEGLVLLSTCYHPKSRGSISLRSRSIFDHPLIDPQYYSDPWDVNCTRKAMKLAVRLVDSETFERLGAKIEWPKLTQCSDIDFHEKFDLYLECVMRTVGMTGHHPGGTCTIGRVVDEDLRVLGVKGLRVIDGSVFPGPVSEFPNALIKLVARRGAQMIVDEHVEKDLK